MKSSAALITSLAALIAAVAWPAAIVILFLLFRSQFQKAFEKLPSILDRMRKFKVGSVETTFEAELNQQAEAIVTEAEAEADEGLGKISAQQIRSAARIEVRAQSVDDQTLRNQLQQLCIEYDTIRKVMPSGAERSRAMTDVMVRMRTLGSAVSRFVDELKASSSAGNRLAAIAIMQIEPDKADIEWLIARFRTEHPFLFFHAAVALRSLVQSSSRDRAEVVNAARTALDIVKSFKGAPDQGTMNVLKSIIGATS